MHIQCTKVFDLLPKFRFWPKILTKVFDLLLKFRFWPKILTNVFDFGQKMLIFDESFRFFTKISIIFDKNSDKKNLDLPLQI